MTILTPDRIDEFEAVNNQGITFTASGIRDLIDTIRSARAEITVQQELLRDARELMEQELDDCLHSACVVRDGVPDRSTLDDGFDVLVRQYDELLARMGGRAGIAESTDA